MDKTVPSYHTNFPSSLNLCLIFLPTRSWGCKRISSTVTTGVASQVVLWLSWSFSSLQRFFLSSSREYCFPLCENFSRDLSEQVCQKLNCNLSAFVFAVLYVGYLTSVWFVHKCIDFISFVSFCFCSNFLCCTLAVSSCLLTRPSSHFFSIAFFIYKPFSWLVLKFLLPEIGVLCFCCFVFSPNLQFYYVKIVSLLLKLLTLH